MCVVVNKQVKRERERESERDRERAVSFPWGGNFRKSVARGNGETRWLVIENQAGAFAIHQIFCSEK